MPTEYSAGEAKGEYTDKEGGTSRILSRRGDK
jgi:hypothetical protein